MEKQCPTIYKLLYVCFAAPLLFSVYFQFMTIRHARSCFVIFILLEILFSLISLGALNLHFLIGAFEGTWFVVVSQSNHVVMEVSYDDSKLSWLQLQLKGTCNIIESPFNDWFTGHLNFQIEHHLFSTMPRHNLYKNPIGHNGIMPKI
ncbi:unnamed protein product [Rotaria socialis]|uniref:Fatty acid desaturase domain-containing protein n=1 Tax=Rotaria socialis TaxID=392032 RepID=A0A820LM74_9BILA|nr:unnamed protein product [Rotaria socialis]